MAGILIVDDEKVLAESLAILFTDEGHEAKVALCVSDARAVLTQFEPDIVLLDLRLPDVSGLEFLPEIRQTVPDALPIMMTAYGDTDTVVQAMKMGAFHYINKPFELQEILHLVSQALKQQNLREEVDFLRKRSHPEGTLDKMVGNCGAMQEVFDRICLVANAGDSSVLITGESGTGKELVASALHRLSDRKNDAFVEVNCSAIPENLLESELFGYEKGAFTNASGRKKGLFELADKGTIFLDEIGEMPQPLQAKLLRFLENHTFRRLGGTTDISIQTRIVAATNRDLKCEVQKGNFREDLYYRLNVIPIPLPPLRERGEDILLLARHFLSTFCMKLGRPAKELAEDAQNAFLAYPWPGNIRELKNIVERLVILCPEEEISASRLPAEIARPSEPAEAQMNQLTGESLDETLARIERSIVNKALEESRGHKGNAAQKLGISRHSMKRRLQKLGMDSDD